MNETSRWASSLRLIENECIVDGYGSYLMPATPIFQKITFSKKVSKTKQILKISKTFFFISGSNFIGLFNGTLFVFIISVVTGAQKETFLPVYLNWPPLYISWAVKNSKTVDTLIWEEGFLSFFVNLKPVELSKKVVISFNYLQKIHYFSKL